MKGLEDYSDGGARRLGLLSEFFWNRSPMVAPWLEDNISLPRIFSPRAPGPVSFDQRPFSRPILETCGPESGTTDCTVSGGTQSTKTAILLMMMAYRLKHVPLPMLLAVPSIDFAKSKIVARRLHPLINENPILAEEKPRDLDRFTLTEMHMQGGEIAVAGAGSPTNLSSISCGLVFQDEVCKFPHITSEDNPEAHPMLLADERTKDFEDFGPFRYKSSSPNNTAHPFWKDFEAGTQEAFFVPCPNSGGSLGEHYFELDFKHDEKDGFRSVVWDRDARDKNGLWDRRKVEETARQVCPHCGYKMNTKEKNAAVQRFELKALNDGASKKHRSFHVPSILSPRVSIGREAVAFLKGFELVGLQNFYNSWLALPFSDYEAKVEEGHILALKDESYSKGELPRPPVALIATCDPGETVGSHHMVSAVMENGEIYVIDWGQVLSHWETDDHLRNRAKYKLQGSKRYFTPGGGYMDSRFNSEDVYSLCAKSGGFWMPTRGSDVRVGTWHSSPIATHPGQRVIIFSDWQIKTELYGRRIAKGEAPRIHIPKDADQMLISQLSGQELDAVTGKWKRLPNDHLGDCLKQVVLSVYVRNAFHSALDRAAELTGNPEV